MCVNSVLTRDYKINAAINMWSFYSPNLHAPKSWWVANLICHMEPKKNKKRNEEN